MFSYEDIDRMQPRQLMELLGKDDDPLARAAQAFRTQVAAIEQASQDKRFDIIRLRRMELKATLAIMITWDRTVDEKPKPAPADLEKIGEAINKALYASTYRGENNVPCLSYGQKIIAAKAALEALGIEVPKDGIAVPSRV